ncbi:RHS repeat domain-containing protein [Undibacterium flavidum]|uniref:Teneurin-like YD-shell domain-containing protein n=1 Tax=Undibacterium flavidum TaxID=2762297 RepID=A0ABR6YB72_9BURK|nr:RHS repeat-associated core domain-containing protein [Undibacterium flavidum]MBC3873841.1 hypothetical protein [Undibacterium flavidum]
MRPIVSTILFAASMFGIGLVHAQQPSSPYNYSRTSAFVYDTSSGLLLSETVEPDNADSCLKTTYTYDVYGNKTSATTNNCADASTIAKFTARSSTSFYGTQSITINGTVVAIPGGAFPTTVTNALSQSESKTFDPRFGAVVELVGPNSLTTSWQVDDFGRKVKESRADGTSTISKYCFISGRVTDITSNSAACPTPAANEIPADAVSFVHTEPRNTSDVKNGPFARTYVDRAGRKIRTVTEAFDGSAQPGGTNRLIVQDIDYNPQGAAIVTTQPYFLDTLASTTGGSSSYGMSATIYDALGRPTAIYTSDPQGSLASYSFGGRGSRKASVNTVSYVGLVKTTTNDLAQTRKEEKNIDGKVVRVTDHLGAQVAHQHDAFGNLVATKDALQNVISIKYDIRGRKVEMTDPNTGLWKYDYNALGELVWQQNPTQRALSQVTTMTYDLLGRMTQKVEPEYTSNWAYDKYADGSACNKGVGKLCETTTSHGINRKVVYDNLGRPINSRTNVLGGRSFATAISYDSSNARPATQTYPTGLTVNYNYTAKGFLSSLTLGTAATITPSGATLAAGSTLWQAQAYNAWGSAEQQIYGNNVISKANFDTMTGRISSNTAGLGTATNIVNYSYAWDSLSHLTGRTDANGDGVSGAVTDSFAYDGIGRLKSYSVASPTIPSLQRDVTLQYNAAGMLLYKSDVGIYTYQAQGATTIRPHALQSVSGSVNANYTYDANGNLKTASAGSYRDISYTSFNLPDNQNGLSGPAGSPKYTWQYDENHQRIQETRVSSAGTRITWKLHPDNAGGLSFEREEGPDGTSNRHYLTAGGISIGVLISSDALPTLAASQTAPVALSTITLKKVEYWHKDHLGSLVATTDQNGVVTARYSYDPFGKRRMASGNYDANGTLIIDWSSSGNGNDIGYTGHEHLDDVGVIHMNGRIYDPLLGRFMQTDPFIQDPLNLQNYNRYGYCYNNPLVCTDPTGQAFGFDDFVFALIMIYGAERSGVIDKQTARAFYGIAVTMYLGPTAGQAFTASGMAQAAAAGFAGGAVSTGTMKGALSGAFSAGMFYGAGNVIGGSNFFGGAVDKAAEWTYGSSVALHGVVGCVTSVAGGGKCGPGALSAAFSKAMTPVTGPMTDSNPVGGVIISAIAGGTGSVLGGGKFANGAQTGAFSYLLNCLAHECLSKKWDKNDPGYHEYQNMSLRMCHESMVGCYEAVSTQLLCNSGPGQTACMTVGKTLHTNLIGIFSDNPVTQYAYTSGFIVNGTGSTHILRDGYVVRQIIVDEGGYLRIYSYGEGVNINRFIANWNKISGPVIFRMIDHSNGAEVSAKLRKK